MRGAWGAVMAVALIASVQAAEPTPWTRVIEVADGEAVFYIDRTTIKRERGLVKVWELQDLRQKTPEGVRSMKLLLEFDCRGGRSRVVFGTSHAEPMAGGAPLGTDKTPGEWTGSTPGTVAEAIQQAVCAPPAKAAPRSTPRPSTRSST